MAPPNGNNIATLGVEFDIDPSNKANGKLDAIINKLKQSETQVRAIQTMADRTGKSWDEMATKVAKNIAGISEASEEAATSANKNAAANDNAAKSHKAAGSASAEHAEKLSTLQKIAEQLNDKVKELAKEAGGFGGILTSIGPVGLAAAAGLGAFYIIAEKLAGEAERMGKLAGQLTNLSNATGLTTDQLQALQNAGTELGLTADQTGNALLRFSSAAAMLRDGAGALYDPLTKIDPVLRDQLSMTKDVTEQINLLAEAYVKADASLKPLLVRAATGGRGTDAAAFGSLLKQIAESGGVDKVTEEVNKLDVITKEQIKNWNDLSRKIEDASSTAKNNIASIFTTSVLENQLKFAERMLELSRLLKDWTHSEKFEKFMNFISGEAFINFLQKLPGVQAVVAGAKIAGTAVGLVNENLDKSAEQRRQEAAAAKETEAAVGKLNVTERINQAIRDTRTKSYGVEARDLQDRVSALGSAASAVDQYNLKIAQLNKLLYEDQKINKEQYDRAKAGAALDRDNAILAARVGILGQAVPLSDQLQQKENALQEARMKGATISKEEVDNQKRLIEEQYSGVAAAKAQSDAQQVQNETLGMSAGAAASYTMVQNKLNENRRLGIPLSDTLRASLQREADAYGEKVQSGQQAAAQDKANFDLQTAFLSQIDQQIASVQKQLHGSMWQSFMNDGLAATMRLADAFKTIQSSVTTFATGFLRDLTSGVPAVEALQKALVNLAQSVLDASIKKLVNTALSSLAGSLGDLLGSGAQGAALTTAGATVNAQMVSGATEAATILTTGGGATGTEIATGATTGATTLEFAGEGTGLTLLTAGEGTAAALEAGGVAAGLAINGPLVALIAAIAAVAALVGFNIFGGKKQDSAAEQLKQAREAFAAMTQQINEFNAAAAGFKIGNVTSSINSLRQQYDQLGEAAAKAQNWGALRALQETFNIGVSRIIREYTEGKPVLSEFQQKLQDAREDAESLRIVLTQMGVSAQDAANIIQTGLNKAIADLRAQAAEGLRRDINTNSGVGWLNDINDAVAKFNDLAGQVDPGLLDTWFRSALQKIVDDAKLQGTAFQNLVNGMPQIAAYIHEYTEAVDESAIAAAAAAAAQEKANLQLRLLVATTDQSTLSGALAVNAMRQQIELQQAIANNSQNIDLLKQVQAAETFNIVKSFADKQVQAEQQAADQRARILEQATNDYNAFVRNIRDYINHFLSGPGSTLSPSAQLGNAQSSFASQLAAAQGGNRDALNSITSYASDLIDAAKNYYGGTLAGQNIINTVLSQLNALPSQVSPEQFIVNAINSTSQDQVDAITDMQTTLQTLLPTGNIAAMASALLFYLPKIDTNSDGSISFDEMKAALGTNYDTGTLNKVFTALDADGSKLISKMELVKAATSGTKTNTDPIVDVKTATNTVAANTTALAEPHQLSALTDIAVGIGDNANTSNTLANRLNSINGALVGGTDTIGNASVAMRKMMIQQNSQWGVQALTPLPVFMTGGYTGGGGDEIVGGVHSREYVLNRATTERMGVPLLDFLNGGGNPLIPGNDNAEVVEAIEHLTTRLENMEDRLVRVQVASTAELKSTLMDIEDNTKTYSKTLLRRA